MRRTTAAALAALAAPAAAQPAHQPADKSGYTLLNPAPREFRRPLSADRPDATESPYTVDAGAIQIELSLVEYATSDDSAGRTHEWSIAPTNLKIGLTNSVDLQLLLDPWLISDEPGDRRSGIGNSGVRLKINVVGNDEGDFAAALLPYVLLPTGSDSVASDEVSAGLVTPVAWDLGDGWSIGAQAEIATIAEGSGRDTVLAHTLVVGREIGPRLGLFAEYLAEVTLDGRDDYSPSLSGGFTWALSADLQLDAAVVFGLDEGDTDDVALFTGITARF